MPQGVPNHTTHFVLKVCGGQPGSWFPFFLCTFASNREESIKKNTIHRPSSVISLPSSVLIPSIHCRVLSTSKEKKQKKPLC